MKKAVSLLLALALSLGLTIPALADQSTMNCGGPCLETQLTWWTKAATRGRYLPIHSVIRFTSQKQFPC